MNMTRFEDLLKEMGAGASDGSAGKPKRDYSETRLQIYQNYYLRGQIKNGKHLINVKRPFDCIAFHPVNEYKDEKEAMWASLKGIERGITDWIILWRTGWGAIETKTKSGLSPYQVVFKRKVLELGGQWALSKSVSDLRDALISFGLTCHNMTCIEPPPSKAEQQAAYLNMMMPHE